VAHEQYLWTKPPQEFALSRDPGSNSKREIHTIRFAQSAGSADWSCPISTYANSHYGVTGADALIVG
jgi:hypothetical protein